MMRMSHNQQVNSTNVVLIVSCGVLLALACVDHVLSMSYNEHQIKQIVLPSNLYSSDELYGLSALSPLSATQAKDDDDDDEDNDASEKIHRNEQMISPYTIGLAAPIENDPMSTSASHHHHKKYVKGMLDMGAWTKKKGAFGWYADFPVGGKGKK